MRNVFIHSLAPVTRKLSQTFAPTSSRVRRQFALVSFAVVCVSLLLEGCATTNTGNPMPPAFYALGASAATKAGLSGAKPETIAKVAASQAVVCDLVRSNVVKPEDISRAIAVSGVKDDVIASAAADLVLMAYIGVFHSQTNEVAARPYATAIFCDGWAAGLAVVSGPKSRAMPSRSDQMWPLLTLPAR